MRSDEKRRAHKYAASRTENIAAEFWRARRQESELVVDDASREGTAWHRQKASAADA